MLKKGNSGRGAHQKKETGTGKEGSPAKSVKSSYERRKWEMNDGTKGQKKKP